MITSSLLRACKVKYCDHYITNNVRRDKQKNKLTKKKIDHRVGPDGRPDVMTTHPPNLLKWRFWTFCGDLGSRTSGGRPPSSPFTGQDVNHQSPL